MRGDTLQAPECTVAFTYAQVRKAHAAQRLHVTPFRVGPHTQKWIFMELFPVLMAGVLLVSIGVSSIVDTLRTRVVMMRERRTLCDACANTGDVLVGGIFTCVCAGGGGQRRGVHYANFARFDLI